MAFGYKVYFSDRMNNRVFEWNPDTRGSKVIAENLKQPYGLAMDRNKRLLISDKLNSRILRYYNNGRLEEIKTYDPDGHRKSRFTHWQNYPFSPTGIFPKPNGILLVSYCDDRTIYRVHPDGKLEWVLGIPRFSKYGVYRGFVSHFPPDEIDNAPVYVPTSPVETKDGTIYFIERGFQSVRIYHPDTGLSSFFPFDLKKKFERITDPPKETEVTKYYPPSPTDLAIGDEHTLFLSDNYHRCVYEIDLKTKKMYRVMHTSNKVPRNDAGPAAITWDRGQVLWVSDGSDNEISAYKKLGRKSWQKLNDKFRIPHGNIGSGGAGIVCG